MKFILGLDHIRFPLVDTHGFLSQVLLQADGLQAARILDRVGCDVRFFDPFGLPVKDDVQHDHPKVQEL